MSIVCREKIRQVVTEGLIAKKYRKKVSLNVEREWASEHLRKPHEDELEQVDYILEMACNEFASDVRHEAAPVRTYYKCMRCGYELDKSEQGPHCNSCEEDMITPRG